MPKMMANMDPEQLEEMKAMQASSRSRSSRSIYQIPDSSSSSIYHMTYRLGSRRTRGVSAVGCRLDRTLRSRADWATACARRAPLPLVDGPPDKRDQTYRARHPTPFTPLMQGSMGGSWKDMLDPEKLKEKQQALQQKEKGGGKKKNKD